MTFEEILETRNRTNAFGNLLGIRLTRVEQFYAEAQVEVREDFLNPQNAVHGGLIYTLADLCVGGAACTAGDPPGVMVATVDGTFHYLRPGIGCRTLYAKSRKIKVGSRFMVFGVTVEDQTGRVLAEGIFTYASLGKPLGSA